jgi:hypothetical protein
MSEVDQKGSAALPEPLRGSDQDNLFAYQTISARLPRIARQVAVSHAWHADARRRLQALIDEMPYGRLRPLQDPDASDADQWEQDFAPYVGHTWLEAPWFAVETYFFRRILEATGYYPEGPGQGIDPYRPQKLPELGDVPEAMHAWEETLETLYTESQDALAQEAPALVRLMHLNIWGNQADRSMWQRGAGKGPARPQAGQRTEHLLVDDARAASEHLVSINNPGRVDFILDNGGIELAYDLGLADFLLCKGLAATVQLHVKPHPTYVSDATRLDVLEMVDFLAGSNGPSMQQLGIRLRKQLTDSRLWMATDYFWTSPLSGWQMPEGLYAELKPSALIISKGDVNYRRWLGDRHWPHTTPLAEILDYLPAPWLALRVLKANVMAGLLAGQVQAAIKKDSSWMTSGQWGCIQFVK